MNSQSEKNSNATPGRIALVAWMLCAATAHAGGSAGKLTLSVYEDTAGASNVLAGRYEAAVKQLSNVGANYQSQYASTNLCVALIMTKQVDAATSACDDAIKRAKSAMPRSVSFATQDEKGLLALAYSNRAVLYYLQKQPQKASEAVAQARTIAPKADFVAANLRVMNSKSDNPEGPSIALAGH
jgi:tetratricopeptide (TPR) repeat protein